MRKRLTKPKKRMGRPPVPADVVLALPPGDDAVFAVELTEDGVAWELVKVEGSEEDALEAARAILLDATRRYNVWEARVKRYTPTIAHFHANAVVNGGRIH